MAPRQILLMRHAEKPNTAGDINLSPAGSERASKLATFIPERFGVPDYIFATKQSSDSNRPVETVEPLSQKTGVPIEHSLSDAQHDQLAQLVLSDAKYSGKVVLICWHHEEIPHLAHELNAQKGDYPKPWDNSVFNLILQFDYSNGASPKVTKVVEPF